MKSELMALEIMAKQVAERDIQIAQLKAVSEQGADIDEAVQYILNVCNVKKPDQQYAESGDPLTQRERVREIVAALSQRHDK